MDLLSPDSGIDLFAWRLRTNVEEEGRFGDRPPVCLEAASNVINSIISPGCRIAGHVENSVLSPGVRIAAGAVISNSVIMHDTSVGENARIDEAIVDKCVSVGHDAILGHGPRDIANHEDPDHLSGGIVLVGKDAEVPASTKVGRNCILHPEVRPEHYASDVVAPGETLRPNLIEV